MIASNTVIGGRYRVVKPLGGGGMKLVYLAEDLRLASRPCALAEMVDSFTSPDMQRQAVSAFQREADMLAQLANEHIPRVFDRFSEENHHYLVMEFIDGITLEQRIKDAGGKLGQAEVIDIALQILDTLGYLHNLQPPVVYRDLKPSNVMLTKSGQAKLIDFGIARHFAPRQNATMIGTQGYAPPEQYRGRVEFRSDLYALGATMHHALSGRDPALEAPFSFPPLHSLCPDIAPDLADVVDQALKYDVALRIGDVAEFKDRLLAIKAGGAHAPGASAGPAGARTDPSAAAGPQKPQLRLPLSTGGARQQAASPSALTVLTALADMECPVCARRIPADSRFCSFCAADLRRIPARAETGHEDATVVLGDFETSAPYRDEELAGAPMRRKRPSALRHIGGLFLLAFIGAIAATFVMSHLDSFRSGNNPPETGGGFAPVPGAPGESGGANLRALRLTALRRALDAQGYRSVQFRLEGDTLVLWGTVDTETDRVIVQTLVFTQTGIFSMVDHIQVRDTFADP